MVPQQRQLTTASPVSKSFAIQFEPKAFATLHGTEVDLIRGGHEVVSARLKEFGRTKAGFVSRNLGREKQSIFVNTSRGISRRRK